jgi:hypothetical protein
VSDSSINIHPGGTTYSGPDAVALYRARMLASSLRLYARTSIRPTRTVGPARMLQLATEITRKKYKRGEYLRAADDVLLWADTMLAALPIERE